VAHYEGVTRGIHLCDIAASHVAVHAADRYALDETLKLTGIDCDYTWYGFYVLMV
jgi:hypothetical protein